VGIKRYKIKGGLLLNPLGRTGIYGRGDMFFWGPNHCIQNIFIDIKSNRAIVAINDDPAQNKRISFPSVVYQIIFHSFSSFNNLLNYILNTDF